MAQISTDVSQPGIPPPSPDVLTLGEAAAYLRVSEAEILNLVREQALPGRKIGDQWRFLKLAVGDWLRTPGKQEFWARHFGALKDDPFLGGILERVESERKQASSGEG
jgi:excisionase family DNA binding protein